MPNKTFTLKDLISYSSPCFSCQNIPTLFAIINSNNSFVKIPISSSKSSSSIDLIINYNNSLALSINHASNKFSSNNPTWLLSFLKNKNISLTISCQDCNSFIESLPLSFNFNKSFINPITLKFEMFSLIHNSNIYHIKSSFINNITTIIAHIPHNNSFNKIKLSLPLIPKSKFISKSKLINKIKSLILFS